jgi:formiminotetrahydrofolate cyclodeaminase
MLRKIGQMMNQNCCSGLYKNIVEEKIFNHKNWIKTIGWKLPDLYLVEMILNVNINLIKIKNLQSKKVTGLKEKMKNLLDLSEKMAQDNGVKLPLLLMQI